MNQWNLIVEFNHTLRGSLLYSFYFEIKVDRSKIIMSSKKNDNEQLIETSISMLKKIESDLNKLKQSKSKTNHVIEYYLAEKKGSKPLNWTTRIAILSSFLLFITVFGLYCYVKLGLIRLVYWSSKLYYTWYDIRI